MEQLLTDTLKQQELINNGFVQLQPLSQSVIEQLQRFYTSSKPLTGIDSFFTSTLSTDETYRAKVNSGILEILAPELEKIFTNYQPVNANFMVKPSGDAKTTCQLHQDWTYVDEEKYLAVNIWIPLIDLTPKNGAMHFIKGSHRFDKRIRGRNIYWPYYDTQRYFIENLTTPVYLKKGEPVIFIGKTFHYSPPNISGVERVGASVVVVHKEAQLYNYFQRDNNIFRAKVDAGYFTQHGVNSVDYEKNLQPEFFANAEEYKREANHELLAKAASGISS